MLFIHPLKKPLVHIFLTVVLREIFFILCSFYNLLKNVIPVFLNCYNPRTPIFFPTGGGGAFLSLKRNHREHVTCAVRRLFQSEVFVLLFRFNNSTSVFVLIVCWLSVDNLWVCWLFFIVNIQFHYWKRLGMSPVECT